MSKTTTLYVHHAFCTFFCRHCTTTKWKYLISRFVEDVKTRQPLSCCFPELWFSLLELNSRKTLCQHLPNWTRWNKRDQVWSSASSLFEWRFCNRTIVVAQAPLCQNYDRRCTGFFFREILVFYGFTSYALLTKRAAKMAGYWPSSFSRCVSQ